MQLYGNEVEKYLQRFLYPCIVVLGIAGNALNLTVLLNRSMRSRL
uniref:G_PROTEIN_RECEP_F1_2 domain-containing protein n=1 Tax=Elaeophora elaphi TaxID=1147741 RepID=A0A0R3RNH5_9BILA